MKKHFDILLAGHIIRVNHIYDEIRNFCKDYIVENKEPDFSVTVNKDLLKNERATSALQQAKDGLEPIEYSDNILEITAVHRLIASKISEYGITVFHGCAVAVDGEVYLFTAKSGTGKTTHSKLWLKNIPNSYILNGDKPMLEVEGNKTIVYGTPWMGKENFGKNETAILKAICILERAKDNSIEEIAISEALPYLIPQTFFDNNSFLAKNLRFFSDLEKTNSVSFYRLKCNMNDEAAIISYNKMSKKAN